MPWGETLSAIGGRFFARLGIDLTVLDQSIDASTPAAVDASL
jgi:hypothetical protein